MSGQVPECEAAASVLDGRALAASEVARAAVTELAPDGVASVRVGYRSGATVTATVAGNVFTFTPPQGPVRKALRRLMRIEKSLTGAKTPSKKKVAHWERQLTKWSRHAARLAPSSEQLLDASGNVIRTLRIPLPGPGEGYAGFSVATGAVSTGPTGTLTATAIRRRGAAEATTGIEPVYTALQAAA